MSRTCYTLRLLPPPRSRTEVVGYILTFVGALFVTYIYQPFFNILVGLYWLVGRIFGDPDMGVAVILFALVVRIILLPPSILPSTAPRMKKIAIANKIKQLQGI